MKTPEEELSNCSKRARISYDGCEHIQTEENDLVCTLFDQEYQRKKLRDAYIARSRELDFVLEPKPNPFSKNNTDKYIVVNHHNFRPNKNIKWAMMTVFTDFDAKSLSVTAHEELFKAVITTQSYLAGSDRTLFTLKYFTRLWFKFQLRLNTNPHLFHECFCPMFSRNKESYIDMLCRLFPTLLHSLYRYSTSVLGCSANTSTLVDLMNQKCKMEYPECPIRSNLSLNKYHFWKIFKKFGG